MAKLRIEVQATLPSAGVTGNPYPYIERFTLATLPQPGGNLKATLVTDGTYAPGSGQGLAYVGGGSLLNLVWWNGFSWITV
jgi:hypothetical protein